MALQYSTKGHSQKHMVRSWVLGPDDVLLSTAQVLFALVVLYFSLYKVIPEEMCSHQLNTFTRNNFPVHFHNTDVSWITQAAISFEMQLLQSWFKAWCKSVCGIWECSAVCRYDTHSLTLIMGLFNFSSFLAHLWLIGKKICPVNKFS